MNRLWGWISFNDRFAVLVLGVITLLWTLDGFGWRGFKLDDAVSGALVASFTLVIQYFFRKGPPTGNGNPGG